MKKSFTILLSALSLCSVAFAQPTFTSVPVPAIGSTISMYSKTDNTVNPGNAGTSQVWDFSNVTFSSQTTSQIVDPATTGYQSQFPSANRVESTAGGNYVFMNLTTTKQVLWGQHDNTQGITVPYSDPLTLLTLPISFGGTQTDNYSASFSYAGISATMTGNITTEYDGYGTLKTVNGTYNNVVRFKATKTDVTTYNYPQFPMSVTINSVSYSWQIPGATKPLFSIMDITVSGMGSTSTQRTVMMADPSTVTDNKDLYLKNLSISVSPNPVADRLNIQFNDLFADEYTSYVIDEKGNVVLSETNNYDSGDTQTLDISNLPQGIYFVRVSSSKGNAVEKIIKR